MTVIIPHSGGKDILRHCLESLRQTEYSDYKILIVNNGSADGSREMIHEEFPEVQIVESKTNLGFAGGCNLGIRTSRSPNIVLLNNDTETTPGWLRRLVEAADKDENVAAVQPKILSFQNRRQFDYSGAAGGELDLFGYPFAWGRLFDSIEIDTGQYDVRRPIFWATGAAVLIRRSALQRVGLLDERFFAHMEEIDLSWRFHWAGYKVMFEPGAVVYHRTGGTLGQERFQKMVLNHRNSLLMILRNHTGCTLLWVLPIRLLLEGITVIMAVLMGQPRRSVAVLCGLWGVIVHWKTVISGRRNIHRFRSIPETDMLHLMYRGSTALAYYLRGIHKAKDLLPERRH